MKEGKQEEPNPKPPKKSELSEGLEEFREALDVEPSAENALEVPYVWTGLPIDELAEKVANLLRHSSGRWGLFRKENSIVTIDEETGTAREMTSTKFRTWFPAVRGAMPVAKWIKTEEVDEETGIQVKKPIKGELTKDQAAAILASDVLLSRLPVLNAIHKVRLPVLDDRQPDENGRPKLRLLDHGYDPATGIFTLRSGLDYDTELDFQEGVKYLFGLFRFFSWRCAERDFAIHLAAAMTLFGRGLYAGKAPMFVYNANLQESGKTTLASWCVWLVYGSAATRSLLKDEDEKLKEALNTSALHRRPYIIFDNVNWGNKPIESAVLDEWITNPTREFRKLGGNEQVEVPSLGVSLMTGNGITLSPDLARRSLMVDLLNRTTGAKRTLPKGATLIDAEFFNDPENRKRGLAALWSMLKQWDADGRPRGPGRLLGSFESWSRTIPGIVHRAGTLAGGFDWDCMRENENQNVGDRSSREYESLATLALEEFGPDPKTGEMREVFEITVAQFAGVARRNAIATEKLWPELDIESVLQTEGQRGGWTFVPPSSTDPGPVDPDDYDLADDAEDLVEHEKARFRSASEWMSPKTRSSFGNALKARFEERYFTGPDGSFYEFRHRRNVTPARYHVERVK